MQPEELATGQSSPFAVALDGGGVYRTNGGACDGTTATGSVMASCLPEGLPVAVAIAERCPEAIAVDGDCVYWANDADIDVAGDDSIVRSRKMLP